MPFFRNLFPPKPLPDASPVEWAMAHAMFLSQNTRPHTWPDFQHHYLGLAITAKSAHDEFLIDGQDPPRAD